MKQKKRTKRFRCRTAIGTSSICESEKKMTKCDWCKSIEHITLLEDLCSHDLETQRRNKLIGQFFDVYPQIYGLSYTGADVLRVIKNLKLKKAAITVVAEEISKRPKTGEPGYSLTRRRVTEGKVRELVSIQRILIEGTDIERKKLAEDKERETKEQLQICPECHKPIQITFSKRDRVVSLRTTEAEDDAYTWIANAFGVDRSYALSVFLEFGLKFPEFLKK